MPRVTCPKCHKPETILKSGFVRGKQRFYCKECVYNFTVLHQSRKNINKSRKHNTTIIDIAKAIGISHTTVSRALRDHPDISNDTKTIVKEVAIRMNYQPNTLAQSLANSQSNTIGVVLPNLKISFFSLILDGIQDVATDYGYKVIICSSNENFETEVINVQTLINNWIDGLIVCHSLTTKTFDHIAKNLEKGIPIFNVYRVSRDLDMMKVVAEDEKGASELTQHLIEQGCRQIAVIAGPKDLQISEQRLNGYRNALRRARIPVKKELIAHTMFTKEEVIEHTDRWLSGNTVPDAIFAFSDTCAITALLYLKQKNINVPSEICIAGFGNDATGEVIEPSLTTFNTNTYNMGTAIAKQFFKYIMSPDDYKPTTLVAKGNIIIRSSSLRRSAL